MVTRILLLLGAVVALLAVACGGGKDSSPTATRAPSITTTPVSASSGPQALVSPKEGPPGTEITVSGSGWAPGVSIDLTGDLTPGLAGDPYKTVTAAADGSFSTSFRLEKTAGGETLATGRYNLIARSEDAEVTIPFLVETRRPVGGTGPTG
jgi:hypothetical protein